MKKVLLTLACAMTSLFASAQAKTAAVGLNLNYGTEIESLGLGVKGSYCFTDHIRGEASFNYFFPKDHFTMWKSTLTLTTCSTLVTSSRYIRS